MELERNTIDNLIKYLKEHGYPDSSFATEYKIGDRRIDLAIIDPEYNIPILVFEVKSRKDEHLINMGKKQLESYLRALPDSSVPAYLVFPSDRPPFFEFQRISFDVEQNKITEENVNIQDTAIYNYDSNRQARVSEKIEEKHKENSETIDKFKWLCWGIAVILIIIGFLNRSKVITIDTTDLAFIGAVIGLIIMPFASKLKFLGMEFERFKMTKRK